MPLERGRIGNDLFVQNDRASGHWDGLKIKPDNELLERIVPQMRIIVELGDPGLEKGSSASKRSRQHLSTKTRRRFEDRRANKCLGKII